MPGAPGGMPPGVMPPQGAPYGAGPSGPYGGRPYSGNPNQGGGWGNDRRGGGGYGGRGGGGRGGGGRSFGFSAPREEDPFAKTERDRQEADSVFKDHQNTGINFEAYEDIPVETSGRDVPAPIDSVRLAFVPREWRSLDRISQIHFYNKLSPFSTPRFCSLPLWYSCSQFTDSTLPAALMSNIQRCNYSRPTPVQRHAIPIALNGEDSCGETKIFPFFKYLLFFLPSPRKDTYSFSVTLRRSYDARDLYRTSHHILRTMTVFSRSHLLVKSLEMSPSAPYKFDNNSFSQAAT